MRQRLIRRFWITLAGLLFGAFWIALIINPVGANRPERLAEGPILRRAEAAIGEFAIPYFVVTRQEALGELL
jgi:hypothetical protein